MQAHEGARRCFHRGVADCNWRAQKNAIENALPTLRLIDLACRRADKLLFEGLHLEVPGGAMVWLRGRNGSGKTSLLRLITGLAKPEKGRLLWGEQPLDVNASRQLIYVGHGNALKDDLTVSESLGFLARIRGHAAAPLELRRALELFGMAGRRHALVRSLSQGQKRRVALTRLALEDRPGLWLLDEPFDALDTEGATRLSTLLAAHLARGGSVLLASHAAHWGSELGAAQCDLDLLAAASSRRELCA